MLLPTAARRDTIQSMEKPPAWFRSFPMLEALEPAAAERLARAAVSIQVDEGTVLFRPGDNCRQFFLVLNGRVRVQQLGESGREIVLYRVGPGETCVLTTAGLLANEPYSAEGIADTALEAMAVPAATFEQLVAMSTAFRRFVFTTYARRLAQVMRVVEDVAFRRLEVRLAETLLAHADASGVYSGTHHDLAIDLGTAREVVSRKLKSFEALGLIEVSRGRIVLLDRGRLAEVGAASRG